MFRKFLPSSDGDTKRKKEKDLLVLMIEIYCRGENHKNSPLCKDCQDLRDYSFHRIDLCPFMESKSFCQSCKIHCYEEDMRIKIRQVMRYSGPKMIFHHPIVALRHGWDMFKLKLNRRRLENKP